MVYIVAGCPCTVYLRQGLEAGRKRPATMGEFTIFLDNIQTNGSDQPTIVFFIGSNATKHEQARTPCLIARFHSDPDHVPVRELYCMYVKFVWTFADPPYSGAAAAGGFDRLCTIGGASIFRPTKCHLCRVVRFGSNTTDGFLGRRRLSIWHTN